MKQKESNMPLDLDLGCVSSSRALNKANELLKSNRAFRLKFICKRDEWTHEFVHVCNEPEFKVDENGIRWKRV